MHPASHPPTASRRAFLTSLTAAAAGPLLARDWTGQVPERYPDPDVIAIEPEFSKYIQGNSPIRRLHTGMLWAEGPAWNGSGNYLVWSDIPNNTQMRYLPEDGHVSVMRNNSGNSNGNTFDWQGRQISCEHANRRVVRYELNGEVTVLADHFEGKPFNAPNDAVVHPDGGIWFTDPGYGSMGDYEGNRGPLELKEAVYRIAPDGSGITKVTEDLEKPNGLCFSPDYKKLYVVDTGAPKDIRVYEVKDDSSLAKGMQFAVVGKPGQTRRGGSPSAEDVEKFRSLSPEQQERFRTAMAEKREELMNATPAERSEFIRREFNRIANQSGDDSRPSDESSDLPEPRVEMKGGSDGVRCDEDGNVWASAGWVGDGYDGVHIFNPEGKLIGQIKLPETGSNLCFGGPKRNRLFITASQSLYSVWVNTRGAHFC